MSKLNFTLSILVLPIAFISLHAQTAETKAGTATISGRVTLTSESARGVVLVLQSEDAMRSGDRSPGLRMKTDENGRFRFTGLKAGRYTLTAVAPGFITPVENNIGGRAKAINLADGENVENQDVALKRGAVITGRVTNASGKPVVDQQVGLTGIDERGQPTRSVPRVGPFTYLTDDRGVYRIYGLPAGRYLVSAGFAQREGDIRRTSNRADYQLTYHPDTTEQSRARSVEVSEGFEATGIDIKLAVAKKTYDVFGRVENAETGQPVAGARMFLGTLMDGGKRLGAWATAGVQADARGEFHMPGILPGKYAAFVNPEQGSDLYSEPTVFEIVEEDVTGLIVKMKRGSSISGIAVIEGTNDPAILSKLPQIDIIAHVKSEELSLSASRANPGPRGSFVMKGLKSGMVTFSLSYRSEMDKFSILRIEHNGVSLREGIQVNSGEQVTGVRIVMGPGTNVVRGQLRITGGALPEDAMLIVNVNRAGTGIVIGSGSQVDATGRFAIEGLTPGEYELKLYVYFPAGYISEAGKLNERLDKQAQAVTVSGAQETQVTFVVDLTPKENRQ